jgi:cytochrome oxidase Cu insertion factor (SCO1/SenC/PrrC family)
MTENNPRLLPRSFWIGFSFLSGLLGLAFLIAFLQTSRHANRQELRVIGSVADFTLTNQDGQVTSLATLTNHVWVADIVFTRCAGPCPRMTGQMKSLQNSLPPDSSVKLVTLTTDPDNDTPAVLKKYGQRFDADSNRWMFLTGTKAQIANLAGDSLKLSAVPVKPEDRKDSAELFIHTTIFVVVDKHARLRGFFETGGDGVDWENAVLPRLLSAVHQLENEP